MIVPILGFVPIIEGQVTQYKFHDKAQIKINPKASCTLIVITHS